jgi:hypothetical protein
VAYDRQATPGLTAAGLVVGTPRFMAPEQARGEDASAASDVFSLGATLLFAAAGVAPWGEGPAAAVMGRATRGRIAALRSLPTPLRTMLAPLLERDPDRRPTAAALAGGPEGTQVRTVINRAIGRRAPKVGRRRAGLTGGVAALLLLGAAAIAATLPNDAAKKQAAAAPGAGPTVPCASLPYQPCGSAPAPHTDGRACIDLYADYDDNSTNGCEAEPDSVDGTKLVDARPIAANLVPEDDTDTYDLEVDDRFQLGCDGELRVTLTAPAGGAQRLELLRDGHVVARAASADGQPDTAVLGDPECGNDDSDTIQARVSTVGTGRTAANYRLTRAGSF